MKMHEFCKPDHLQIDLSEKEKHLKSHRVDAVTYRQSSVALLLRALHWIAIKAIKSKQRTTTRQLQRQNVGSPRFTNLVESSLALESHPHQKSDWLMS